MQRIPSNLLAHARQMRKEPTDAEALLWQALRSSSLGARFRRQVPKGHYILDFACLKHRLVVEVDGDQHADCDADRRRDRWLQAQGFQVLRFSNRQVMQELDGVLEAIDQALRATSN